MSLFFGLGIFAGIALVAYLAFKLSPWPAALIIRRAFLVGDRTSKAKLEKHLPSGVAERLNLHYGAGENEVFDLVYPQDATSALPAIVWTHGGGWVARSNESVGHYARILASNGYLVVCLNYTIAPEATYPMPVRQVNAALAHLVANAAEYGIDADRIVLAGDSAGAHITAQVANLATNPDYAARIGIAAGIDASRLAGLLLFCGAYDLAMASRTRPEAWFARSVLWAYSGTRDYLNDPAIQHASVIEYVTPRFPPAFITSGNADPLEHQSIAFAEKIESLGVYVDTLFYSKDHLPKLPHVYQFNLDTADGTAALRRALDFLDTVCARTPSHQPS